MRKLNTSSFIAGDNVTWKNNRSGNIHKAEATIYYRVSNITTGSVYFLSKEDVEALLFSGKVELLDSNKEAFKILFK